MDYEVEGRQDEWSTKKIAMQAIHEISRVENFLHLADSVGVPVPMEAGVSESLRESAKRFAMQISECSEGRPRKQQNLFPDLSDREFGHFHRRVQDFPPSSTLEAFAIAQHYGIGTRLLDWCVLPKIALLFASERAIVKAEGNAESNKSNPEHFAVTAVSARVELSTQFRLRLVDCQRSRIPFLQAQRGIFTLDPAANVAALGKGFTPHCEIIKVNEPQDARGTLIKKVMIPFEMATRVLQILMIEGLTTAHIRPSLDWIAKTLNFYQKHRIDCEFFRNENDETK